MFEPVEGAPIMRRLLLSLCLVALSLLPLGCSYFESKVELDEPIGRVAVLPIRRAPGTDSQRVLPGAERVITAHVYGVLAKASHWDYVPDLTVGQVLNKLPREEDVVAQAVILGKAVKAQSVLCGTVSRYVEREGSEYGARQPAAVGIDLQLVSTATGKVLWKSSFDQSQKALSENLFNWWQFWEGGVRWLSAEEFSRVVVDRMLDELRRAL